MFLKVNNLMKMYGAHKVLKGINFSLEKGEVLSIIGSSGGGKTTLLRSLNFLEIPDEGTIYVDGEKVFDAEEVKNKNFRPTMAHQLKFGLVFQQFNLFPQFSVKRNLTLAAELSAKKQKDFSANKERILAGISKRADALLETVGLSDKAEDYPSQLSGGQQQRVAIARALMLEPEILCFDEPTSALDPELTGEVLKVIKKLRDEGRTMVIVTHELEFARHVSDKIIFMANGVIEEMGTPEEIFDHPKSEKTRLFINTDYSEKD